MNIDIYKPVMSHDELCRITMVLFKARYEYLLALLDGKIKED